MNTLGGAMRNLSGASRRAAVLLACCAGAFAVAAILIVPASRAASPPAYTHYSGTLTDGSTWIANVPTTWNGTLIIFTHGLVANDVAVDAGSPDVQNELLNAGYALAGDSFDPTGPLWPLATAVNDDFQTITTLENSVLPSAPKQVISMGESLGGLISALMAQDAGGRITGSLNVCPLVDVGEVFGNYLLDGSYALNELLDPSESIPLANYSSESQAEQAGDQLMALAQSAQSTAAGRARIALASALFDTPTWTSVNVGGIDSNPKVKTTPLPPPLGNYDAWEQGQYNTEYAPGSIVLPYDGQNRWAMEQASGGQPAWDAGADFTTLIDDSPYYPEISALYTEAGLDLNTDLQTLTANADITSNADALASLISTSVPTGSLQVPELDLHTIADQLVPIQQENYYQQLVDSAGDGSQLGHAYVFRQGHCHFETGEVVAAVEALSERLTTGSWGTLLAPSSLNAAAASYGGGDFIAYSPPALTGVNPAPSSSSTAPSSSSSAALTPTPLRRPRLFRFLRR